MASKFSLLTTLTLEAAGYNRGIDQAKAKTAELKKATTEVNKGISDSFGALKSALPSLSGSFGEIGAALSGVGRAVKGLVPMFGTVKTAIIGTGIGAIVVALSSAIAGIIAWLKRTDEGAGVFRKALNTVKAVAEVVMDKIAALGKALVALIKFDWKGFKENVKDAFTGWGDAIQKNIDKANELTRIQSEYKDLMTHYATDLANLEVRQSELAVIMRNKEKYSNEERKKALDEYKKVLQEIYNLKVKEINLRIGELQNKQSQGYTSKDELRELNELQAQKIRLTAEYNNNIRETLEISNSLFTIEKEAVENLIKAYDATFDEIDRRANEEIEGIDIEAEVNIPEPEKINIATSAYNKAILSVISLNEQLKGSFTSLSTWLGSSMVSITTALSKGANSFREYARNLKSAIKEIISALIGDVVAHYVATALKQFGSNVFTMALAPAAAAAAAGIARTAFNSFVPKFSTGGIVGGISYTGDYVPALVNSGEMVLTRAQQANLFRMINNPAGLGGEVTFRIEGDTLVGVLKNYNQIRSRGW